MAGWSLIQGLVTVFRAVHIFASSLATQGTFLTTATLGSETEIFVENTGDFPLTGSAQIIDSVNDRNTFTYTGVTATSFTGCSGVLAHSEGVIIIPIAKTVVIDSDVNEIRVLGDVGGGTIEEIADIGSVDTTGAVGSFGTSDGLNTGVLGKSNTGIGIEGRSVAGYGGKFTGSLGQLQLVPMSSIPAAPNLGDIIVDNLGNVYIGSLGVGVTVLAASDTQVQESSDNGITFQLGNGLQNRAWQKPVWNGTIFLLIAANSQVTATSTDGITWTEHAGALPSSSNWGVPAWNGSIWVVFVFRGTSPNGAYATSTDGIIWTSRTLNSGGVYTDVVVIGTKFCANGFGLTSTSTNGVNWSSNINTPTLLRLVTINSLFVGVTNSHTYSSTDGLNWTVRQALSITNTFDIRFETFNNIICGIFYANTQSSIYRSVDGLSWTKVLDLGNVVTEYQIGQNGQQFWLFRPGSSAAFTSTDGLTWNNFTLPGATWIGLTGFYTSGGLSQLGWSTALVSGSNVATTGQTLVDVTGLILPLAANATYEFAAYLIINSSTTAGNKYGVNFSAGGATVEGYMYGFLSSVTAVNSDEITAFNSASGAYNGSTVHGLLEMHGIVITGANAGNFSAQHLKVTSGTSTVFINSFLKVRRKK